MCEIHFFELLGTAEAAWTEDIDFHQFVSHNVESYQKHAVLNQFRPNDFRDFEVSFSDDGLPQLAARMNIAAHIIPGSNTLKSRVLALVSKGLPVHYKEPRVALERHEEDIPER